MSHNSSKLIAFNYFGGKFTWLDHLYANFPVDMIHLVDLFGGSFSVSINYNEKIIKTANDINSDVTNFFRVLRDDQERLIQLLLLTPCSEEEFDSCWEVSDDPVEQARRFYVRIRQSFFGLGAQRQNKGFHMAKTQINAAGGETVSKWNNGIRKLGAVADVIRENFQILNCHYLECIDRLDFPDAFFYCDPPYLKSTRASYNDYKFEFSDNDHIQLAEKLRNIHGKAMVSGYDCVEMDELYSGWSKVKFPVKKNNIRSNEVQEVIWFNYPVQMTKKYRKNLFSAI